MLITKHNIHMHSAYLNNPQLFPRLSLAKTEKNIMTIPSEETVENQNKS